MKRINRLFLYIPLIIGLQACSDDDPTPEVRFDVPPSIQPFIDDFIAEGQQRGVNLTIDNLIVTFEGNLQNGDAAGLCTFANGNNPPHIRIDTTSANWRNNDWSREILMFHELGHCVLDRRQHRDDRLPNDNYSSIMRSDGAQVYGGSLTLFKREYYLDELFNEAEISPEWSNIQPLYSAISAAQKSPIIVENFNNNINDWSVGGNSSSRLSIQNGLYTFESLDEGAYLTVNEFNLNTNADFEIETRFRIREGDRTATFQWGGSSTNNNFFYGFNPDNFLFTGNSATGTSTVREESTLSPGEFAILTIRKIGQDYFFYVNEQYFDIGRFEEFSDNLFGFAVGPNTVMEIDFFRIFELNL
ncbi:MAG: hypothetical protein AAF824_11565 [Bacteroidota bacterium]